MKTASFVQTTETKTVIPRALVAMLLVGGRLFGVLEFVGSFTPA